MNRMSVPIIKILYVDCELRRSSCTIKIFRYFRLRAKWCFEIRKTERVEERIRRLWPNSSIYRFHMIRMSVPIIKIFKSNIFITREIMLRNNMHRYVRNNEFFQMDTPIVTWNKKILDFVCKDACQLRLKFFATFATKLFSKNLGISKFVKIDTRFLREGKSRLLRLWRI